MDSRCHARRLVLAWFAVLAMVRPPLMAQVPTASREELMRQWDVNRDGKVDASEAEIARGRMRRARTEAMMNSGNDPVTGRPREATDPITGRPQASATDAADRSVRSVAPDDDDLILVPGNGDRPEAQGRGADGDDMPPRSSRRDREALPGTRAPTMSSTIPSVSPRLPTGAHAIDSDPRTPGVSAAKSRQGLSNPRDAGDAELSSRARLLPGMSPQQNLGGRGPQPVRAGLEQQQSGARPGIIAGGARPGGAGARPGMGAAAPAGDLNAGRLPGGLPQTRGVAPGTAAGSRLGPMQPPNAGRLAGPGPSVPRPGIGPYRGATSPATPSVGTPSVPQPGVRLPDGGRPMSRTPNTVPRVPRMTTDEFYGR